MTYLAQPLSRLKIRAYVSLLREALEVADWKEFPILRFLEHILPQVDSKFNLMVVPINEMQPGREGLAVPEDHVILLREDVYINAVAGEPRARFTVAHEIGHYLLHTPGRVSFARERDVSSAPPYLQPEWQANTFAGELLAPPTVIKGMTLLEVMSHCKVSKKVAEIQMRG